MATNEQVTCPACKETRAFEEYERAERKDNKGTYIDLICPNCEAYIEGHTFIEN